MRGTGRAIAFAAAAAASLAAGAGWGEEMRRIRTSEDGHGFVLEDGTPFFWLGDTAWTLFQQSEKDIEFYLADRAERGFNVIQCMVLRTILPENKDLTPCHSGALPFASFEPLQFNEAYFAHIDFIVNCAARHGLRVAMAAMWGSNAATMFRDPERDNYSYARFLAERYKDRPNVIWIASGEYEKIIPSWKEKMPPAIDERQKRLLSRLGEGLRDGSEGRNLITIHPIFTSARDFHDAPWLDFNMQQTYGNLPPNIVRIAEDYARTPPKPVLNGEPGYERRPAKDKAEEMTPWHLRNEAYWSVFSGGAGFTYGAHGVWEFEEDWREALEREGGSQMRHLRWLIESRPMRDRVPRRKAIVSDLGAPKNQTAIVAAGAADGGWLMVYSAGGRPFEIDMASVSGAKARAWWFNPRDGLAVDSEGRAAKAPFAELPTAGAAAFAPPSSGEGQDWVLVLDDDARGFGAPGSRSTMRLPRSEPPAGVEDPVARSEAYRRIKSEVDRILLIDTHEHLVSEEEYLKRPADFLATMLHYVESDLVSAGMPRTEGDPWRTPVQNETLPFDERWAMFETYWPNARFTGYGRALALCVRDVYGLSLDRPAPEVGLELNRRIADARRPGFYRAILRDKARIELAIVESGTANVDRNLFAPVLRFDNFVTPAGRGQLDRLGKQAGIEIRTLDDLVSALEIAFEQAVREGIVGIKSGLAYRRRISYPLPTEDEARAAFARAADDAPASADELLPLHNYMMRQVCRLAAKHDLPFQIHTGLQTGFGNDIANAKPTELISLIMAHRDVKFVLFHGGYPYGAELGVMAKNFANVFIDMCWLHIISPSAARERLAEWIDTVPANKITGFGGDYNFVEGVCAHAEMARQNVAWVLARKTMEGSLSEGDAMALARKILRDNAIALYRLPLE